MMATNRNNGQIRPADLARGKVINRRKLAELESVKETMRPKPKTARKIGGFV